MIPHLSDDRLIENTKSLFAEERRLDLEVLRHLYEIERRKLFLERGFPSLFEMCIQEFKLSPASAQRRISAMRLLKEIPEVAPKIQTGELSVSVLAQTQSFLRSEKKQDRPYSKQDKLELITSFENKSIRDVEKELAAKNPAVKQYEVVKPVSATQSRLTLILDNETKAMLDQIRDLISHANPEMTYEGVIVRATKLLLEKELKKIQPLERAPKKASKISSSTPGSATAPREPLPAPEVDSAADVQNVEGNSHPPSRTPPRDRSDATVPASKLHHDRAPLQSKAAKKARTANAVPPLASNDKSGNGIRRAALTPIRTPAKNAPPPRSCSRITFNRGRSAEQHPHTTCAFFAEPTTGTEREARLKNSERRT